MAVEFTPEQVTMLRQRANEADSFVYSAPGYIADVEAQRDAAILRRDTDIAILNDAGYPLDPDAE